MIKLLSLLLILVILIFLIRFKGGLFIKFFNKKKLKINNVSETQTKIPLTSLKKRFTITQDVKLYSKNERILLKRKMEELFKGSKEDKLKALKIAKDLSDTSTLHILRMGLKDMDSDIVEISADLINNFK